MALQGNDLFVVQSQTDSKLYKLKLSDLIVEVEGGAGINFKGSVDLNNAPSAQSPTPITLPGQNGDLYIVESDAGSINAGWVMVNGETSAEEGDRIIYDGGASGWTLVTVGSSTTGTVTSVTATLPLKSDGDVVDPVISIRQARTSTGATSDGDGEGTAGAVARLAEAADVEATTGTGAATAVVTADLLKATNDNIVTIEEDIEELEKGGTLSALLGADPIEVTTSVPDADGKTETTVSIKDSTTVQKGAVILQEIGSVVTTSITVAATPGYVDAYYLVKDFDSFREA